ncbi:hypothetical protein Efla_000207 [Eimeria flavescens]
MVKIKQTSEEKLHILHKLILDSDSFFGSKELEKLAEKAGYRSMQAKEALKYIEASSTADAVKMLIDENLVQCDKANERIFEVAALQLQLQQLEDEIRATQSCNRERFQQLTEEIAFARAAIERWTDNIAIIRKTSLSCRWQQAHSMKAPGHFTSSRLRVPEEEVDQLLELPQGWDEVEDGLEKLKPSR